MKLQELTDLLGIIEKQEKDLDLISIKFYSDGSGKIFYSKVGEDDCYHPFDSFEIALKLLHEFANPKVKEKTPIEILENSLLGIISFDSEELRAKYKIRVEKAKELESQRMKEIYLKGIENYDPTFKKE